MNYIFFETATVLIFCLLVHIFFNSWFGLRKIAYSKVAIFVTAYFLLQLAISILPLNPILRAGISYFLVLVIARVLYKTTRISAAYGALIFMVLAVVAEYLCLLFLSSFGFDADILMVHGNYRVIYIALARTVHFVVVLFAASILRKNRATLSLKQIAPLFPCLLISIYITIIFFSLFPGVDGDISLALVFALVGLLYINGVIIFNTQSIKSATVKIEEQKLANHHYEMQKQYYQNVIQDREQTRALWHDLNKYVIAIEALVGLKENVQAIGEYEQIRQAFGELGNIVDTENSILNAILHYNIKQAKSNDISVELSAFVSSDISVSSVDLSVIIGNTFDNAIEECILHESAARKITATITQQNNMIFYEICNPCMTVPQEKKGRIRGYGLETVRQCVEKYNGSMEHGASSGQYRVSIRLNCPQETIHEALEG